MIPLKKTVASIPEPSTIHIMDEPHHDNIALSNLMASSRDYLESSPAARSLLLDNGLSNESIWDRYRLGGSGKALVDELSDEDRINLINADYIRKVGVNAISSPGVLIPTFDPRDPENPIGLIKLSMSQNKHSPVGTGIHRGLACPLDIAQQETIVICDSPLLLLRLAQAGCQSAVLAETPEALVPYISWLKNRTVVIASYKKTGIKNLNAVLNFKTESIFIINELYKLKSDALASLGIIEKPERQKKQTKPITQKLIRDLVAYGQGRLQDGHGIELLKSHGAYDGDLIRSLGLGYLPADYLDALDDEDKKCLRMKLLADTLIVPAYDQRGVAVDLLGVKKTGSSPLNVRLLSVPSGLLCSKMITVFSELIIVGSFSTFAKLWAIDLQNVVFIRDEQDAVNNSQRMIDAGVKKISLAYWKPISAKRIATVFEDNEIKTQILKMPKNFDRMNIEWATKNGLHETDDGYPDPELTKHDKQTELAIFNSHDLTYTVETSPEAESHIEIIIERGEKRHRDRFDMASESQRNRFSESAGAKLNVPRGAIQKHLVVILDAVQKLQRASLLPDSNDKIVVLNQTEQEEALAYLKQSNLMESISNDLKSLSGNGDNLDLLLYMTATSRKLQTPLSVSIKNQMVPNNIDLMPPEDVVLISPLTAPLVQGNRIQFRDKLIAVDGADALTKKAVFGLKLLRASGAVSIISASKRKSRLDSPSFELDLNDTERTQNEMQLQLKLKSAPGINEARGCIIKLHQNVQRLIESVPVLIPFAERISMDAGPMEQEAFLSVISASALLHQYQRIRQGDYLLATETDFQIAMTLAEDMFATEDEDLSSNARVLLSKLAKWGLKIFTLSDLIERDSSWYRRRYLRTLEELVKLQMVASSRHGRGSISSFELVIDPSEIAKKQTVITLATPRVELDKLDNSWTNGLSSLTSDTATG